MPDAAARWIVFQLLRYQDITPVDVLAMWHELDADDGRITFHLRNVLPLGGPVPAVAGIAHQVEDAGYGRPVALVVTAAGEPRRYAEPDLVAICRQLLTDDDPPAVPGRLTVTPMPTRPATAIAAAPAIPSPASPARPDAPPRPRAKGDTRQLSLL